jgi:GNAT superfamily N-acetyltransferase
MTTRLKTRAWAPRGTGTRTATTPESEIVRPSAHDRPRPDGGDIRKLTAADSKTVSRILAQAFYDDPLMGWMMPRDATRLRRLERVFALASRRIWLPQDECFVPEPLIGAAMWMPPDTLKLSPLAQLRMLPAWARVLRGDFPRMMKLDAFVEKSHPEKPAHWYVNAMGVTPAWQGRGYGTVLMRPVLERCDAERVPAYLETATPRGRALYERNGFEVVEECRFADDAPPVWRMWREPRR